MTDDAYLFSLKWRFEFAAWEQASRLDAELHVWRFRLGGGELAGLAPARIEPALPPATSTVMLHVLDRDPRAREARPVATASGPRLSKSFWRPVPPSKVLINIDVYECASRVAAHETLLQVLGGFQSTKVKRRDDLGIGDVAFAMPGGAAMAFARGNLTHLARNASRETFDVTEIARQLDQRLVRRPPPVGRAARAPIEAATGRYRLSAPSAQEERAETPLYLKLFSTAGTFVEEDDQIVLHPAADKGPYELGLVAVYPDQRQLQRILRVRGADSTNKV